MVQLSYVPNTFPNYFELSYQHSCKQQIICFHFTKEKSVS